MDGMTKSAETVYKLIAGEIRAGIPSERIMVGGFSQGQLSQKPIRSPSLFHFTMLKVSPLLRLRHPSLTSLGKRLGQSLTLTDSSHQARLWRCSARCTPRSGWAAVWRCPPCSRRKTSPTQATSSTKVSVCVSVCRLSLPSCSILQTFPTSKPTESLTTSYPCPTEYRRAKF